MAIIKIRTHEVDVDIAEELADYDWGYNARWTSDKLIASSPFRPDSTPSFFVNLEGEYAGAFGDSGAYEDDYRSGNFITLLNYLRADITREDTERYLLDKYGVLYEDEDDIRLPEIHVPQRRRVATVASDSVTQAISPYLTKRGINESTQRLYGVGYSADYKGFTAIPWHTADGRLANVKYRSTSGKDFFYEKGATPVRTLVYGLDVINEKRSEFAVLCEGEIDVMSWATAGIDAIALGGSSISKEQVDAIKRSSIKLLGIGADNDRVGERLNNHVRRELEDYVGLLDVDYGEHKDANDVIRARGCEGLRGLANITNAELRENYLQLRQVSID